MLIQNQSSQNARVRRLSCLENRVDLVVSIVYPRRFAACSAVSIVGPS